MESHSKQAEFAGARIDVHWPAWSTDINECAHGGYGRRVFKTKYTAGQLYLYEGFDHAKTMHGAVWKHAVHLTPMGQVVDTLVIAEGIETALSAAQITGSAAWSALSAGGLGVVELPDRIRNIIITADNGEPGRRAALKAHGRLTSEGRKVDIRYPPAGLKDFNDVLQQENYT